MHSRTDEAPHRLVIHWTPPLSLFVLNNIIELVQKGIYFHKGFKDQYVRKMSEDVLDFTRLTITSTQIYNYLRKWRAKWVRINQLKEMQEIVWFENMSDSHDG